jgi:osmotically-inducible protein OsmY
MICRKTGNFIQLVGLCFLVATALLLGCSGDAVESQGSYSELPDDQITNIVEGELLLQEGVPYSAIDVQTNEGVVTLKGQVTNILAMERAAKVAESVRGVRAVVNQVDVRPTSIKEHELEADVVTALALDPATESYEIDVSAEGGKIILSGTVDSWQERELAEKVAMGVRGVTGLDNHIDVEYATTRSDDEIQNEIEQVLRWDVRVDDALIDVAVEEGKVTLMGTVGSARERTDAAADAWVAGVKDVDFSDLVVEWWAHDEHLRGDKYVEVGDEQIEEAVRDAFLYDPRVISFDPEIDVDDGVVTLRGVVHNVRAKKAAEEDARRVVGVWRVVNHLKVRPEIGVNEDILAQRVREALARDAYVNRYDVTVITHNGEVDLYGTVDSDFEKKRAATVAARIPGVVIVDNHLVSEAAADLSSLAEKSDWEIEKDIQNELFWSPFVDDAEVRVSVDDGLVTLTGTVDTWWERQEAREQALEGGAVAVINRLQVRQGPEYFQPGD